MHTDENMISDKDLAWLAGYLEGEGCFHIRCGQKRQSFSPVVRVAATDEDVVARAARLMGCEVRIAARATVTRKTVYCASVGSDKALEIMRLLRPHMGTRRGAKIDEILHAAESRQGYARGERQGFAKLTATAVRELRMHGPNPPHGWQTEIANRYGVSQASVWYALKGKTWKHVV